MSYEKRQKQPVVLTPDLAHDIWRMIKHLRDDAVQRRHIEETREYELNDLLRRLSDNGGCDHLPTIDEVCGIWKTGGSKGDV